MKNTKFKLPIVIFFILLVSVGIYFLYQIFTTDQTYAAIPNAELNLPANLTISENSRFTVPINLVSNANSVIGVDLELTYSPTQLQLTNILSTSNPSNLKLFLPLNANTFNKSKVITEAENSGKIKFSIAASTAAGNILSGYTGNLEGTNALTQLEFFAKDISSNITTPLQFSFSPNSTTDTNVVTSTEITDMLAKVQNSIIQITTLSTPLPSTPNATIVPQSSPTVRPTATLAPNAPSSTPRPTISPISSVIPSTNQVIIYATGSPVRGVYPEIRLWSGGNFLTGDIEINKSNSTNIFQSYTIPIPTTQIDKLRLYFTNDQIAKDPYEDRNLRVQKVIINNEEYLTASSDVYSVGSCDNTGCGAGFKRSEWLNSGWWTKSPPLINTGYFEFTLRPSAVQPPNSAKNRIEVHTRGTALNDIYPQLDVFVNGQKISQSIQTSEALQQFSLNTDLPINTLELKYINDAYQENPFIDRNVFVDKVVINGVSFETEDSTVYSIGSWNAQTGCSPGYKSSEWLHCSGSITYNKTNSGTSLTPITIRARGEPAQNEYPLFQLHVNDKLINTYQVTSTYNTYSHVFSEGPVQTVKVSFINDANIPLLNQDRNLQIDYVQIGQSIIQTEDSSIESEGAWNIQTGCSKGFKLSEWLSCNGYFVFRI